MNFFKWEFVGMILASIIGIFLYFAYDLSGNNQYVGLIAPINGTIWEHLKMAFYGMMFFALLEYIFIGKNAKNFIFAKTFGAVLACFLSVVFYYGYRHFMDHNQYIDIVVFVAAIIVAQLFSWIILQTKMYIQGLNYIALLAVFCAVFVFSSYTYEPPAGSLFSEIIPS